MSAYTFQKTLQMEERMKFLQDLQLNVQEDSIPDVSLLQPFGGQH